MKIVTISIYKYRNLLKRINEWLSSPCENLRHDSITVNLSHSILEMINRETDNRSKFIRQRLEDYLHICECCFKKPHVPSRSDFVRRAIDHYFIDKFVYGNPDNIFPSEKDELKEYLEENGLHILGEA